MALDRATERPKGRPTLFTPERRAAFIEALALNCPRTIAAKAAGWQHTWKDYLGNGYNYAQEALSGRSLTEREQGFADFYEEVNRVEAARVARNLQVIISAAEVDGTWQAAAWLNERTHPTEFAKRTGVEITGAGGDPLTLEIKMDDLLAALAKLRPDTEVPHTNGAQARLALPPGGDDASDL